MLSIVASLKICALIQICILKLFKSIPYIIPLSQFINLMVCGSGFFTVLAIALYMAYL